MIAGYEGNKVLLDTGGYVDVYSLLRIMEENTRKLQYPTLYAATSPEEHFCESTALLSQGKLPSAHEDAYTCIIVRGKTMKTADTKFPSEPEWATYRRYLVTQPGAEKQARDLLRGKYGVAFADRMMKHILSKPSAPREGNFADPVFYEEPEVFSEAWDERMDLKGRRIGDQVDVTTDAVIDLWEQYLTTVSMDKWMKSAMAGTYAQISREDLEDWLESLPLHHKWERAKNRAGVYLLPVSENVGVKLLSTIGSSDDAMGRGEASMHLSLVSLTTGQVLNKKAQGQSHFARTTNWKKNWRTGFDRVVDAYQRARGFYDALALIDDREQYKHDMLHRIEAIQNWQASHILMDFHGRLMQGGILTTPQVEVIVRAEKATPKQSTPPPQEFTPEQKKFLARMDSLEDAAKRSNDRWLIEFLASIRKRIQQGQPLTPGQ
jgi:hypothetical protein